MTDTDLSVEVEEWESGVEEYTVDLKQYSLTAHPRLDDSDFEYSLSWSRETHMRAEEIIENASEVFIYGDIDMGDDAPEQFYDFFDSDEIRWGCDVREEIVDVNVPSAEKLTSDTLVDLYVQTTNIGENAAYDMLEALQDKVA